MKLDDCEKSVGGFFIDWNFESGFSECFRERGVIR